MQIQIERTHVGALVEAFPELSALQDQLKLGSTARLPFHQLTASQLGFLHDLYLQAGTAMAGRAAQIATLQHAVNDDGERFGEGTLEQLVPAIARFLAEPGLRGWLYRANAGGKALPWLVTRIDYTPPGDEETGRVLIELKANSMGKLAVTTVTLLERDIVGRRLAEIFAAKGFLRETTELFANYTATTEKFFAWRGGYGQQFSGRGTAIFADDPSASHRSSDWSRKSSVVLSPDGNWARLVNDEDILKERELTLDATGDVLGKYLRKAGRSMKYSEKVEKSVEAFRADTFRANTMRADTFESDGKGGLLFTEIPVHGYILMFHLDLHHHLWVHVDDVQPYRYQPELKQKLILPPEQTDLIDILTAEMDVLMDDIIEGKSGGTTVLCAGPAGVGKTLTAEVYSEIIQRPLYRVHSGQLGLNVTEMEIALKNTLTRAQRWGAVMLIDEADVYIKRRDDDIAANAVVGVFLRVLEYFNGLLFLTTNRVNDIDEAIVSRCIALIRYHPPGLNDRRKIWQVMTQQFGLTVEGELLDQLAECFADASGRDIKGLAKLVAKYCAHKSVPPTLAVFERCAIFRGMEQAT